MAVRHPGSRPTQSAVRECAPSRNRVQTPRPSSAPVRGPERHWAAAGRAVEKLIGPDEPDIHALDQGGGAWDDEEDIIAGNWGPLSRRRASDVDAMVVQGKRKSSLPDGHLASGGPVALLESVSILDLLEADGQARLEGHPSPDVEVDGLRPPPAIPDEDLLPICRRGTGHGDRRTELASLTTKELRTISRQYGLVVKGTKRELVARIHAHEQCTGQTPAHKPGTTAADLCSCLSWDLPTEIDA
eukprot:evm.model.scf_2483.4 EVM.evm.TU.scf_2483.4   scf_2483:14734-15959(+)